MPVRDINCCVCVRAPIVCFWGGGGAIIVCMIVEGEGN